MCFGGVSSTDYFGGVAESLRPLNQSLVLTLSICLFGSLCSLHQLIRLPSQNQSVVTFVTWSDFCYLCSVHRLIQWCLRLVPPLVDWCRHWSIGAAAVAAPLVLTPLMWWSGGGVVATPMLGSSTPAAQQPRCRQHALPPPWAAAHTAAAAMGSHKHYAGSHLSITPHLLVAVSSHCFPRVAPFLTTQSTSSANLLADGHGRRRTFPRRAPNSAAHPRPRRTSKGSRYPPLRCGAGPAARRRRTRRQCSTTAGWPCCHGQPHLQGGKARRLGYGG